MAKSKSGKRDAKSGDGGLTHPLYPRCDGKSWNPHENGRTKNGALKRQFLDVYFRINLAYANLLALQKKGKSRSAKSSEYRALQKIEAALLARESLANRHACRGIIATPVYRDGFTVNVLFSDAHTGTGRDDRFVSSSSSVRLIFALPAGRRAQKCRS